MRGRALARACWAVSCYVRMTHRLRQAPQAMMRMGDPRSPTSRRGALPTSAKTAQMSGRGRVIMMVASVAMMELTGLP